MFIVKRISDEAYLQSTTSNYTWSYEREKAFYFINSKYAIADIRKYFPNEKVEIIAV